MSNLDRAIVDLDRGGPRNFNDARHALLDDIQRGVDPRQVVDTVNRIERQPGHAGAQVQLVNDGYGHLDIAPAPYGRPMEPPPPPPPYEGQYEQPGLTPGQAIGAGIVGGLIGGVIGRAITGGHENYYRRRY